jgi:hypothetical protein
MGHKVLIMTGVLALSALTASASIFQQTDSTSWNESAAGVITSTDGNPVTVVSDREWAWVDGGLGVLAGQSVSWSFDFSTDGDSSSVVLGLTSSAFDGSSNNPGDGYIFGFDDGDGSLALGHTDRGGKNKIGATGTGLIIDSGLSLHSSQTATVTVAFDGTDSWSLTVTTDTTVEATGGTFSTVSPVTDTTYTSEDLSYLGVYQRSGNDTTHATLEDMSLVPEPATLSLLGLGGLGVLLRRRCG